MLTDKQKPVVLSCFWRREQKPHLDERMIFRHLQLVAYHEASSSLARSPSKCCLPGTRRWAVQACGLASLLVGLEDCWVSQLVSSRPPPPPPLKPFSFLFFKEDWAKPLSSLIIYQQRNMAVAVGHH